ncbi:MAG: pyridoxamine 5'-phosphate oxidase family protein [Oscillospiraceae bacterium]|nr:pyridoxamine 5'-phosphate oxidase family protein [Oscillospiraceae bacterium]
MFRDMIRKKQQLPTEDCIRLLKTEPRGVLSLMGDGGYPYGLPMDHWYNDADGCLYFHCGKRGHKIDAIRSCDKASFCVMDSGFRREGEWALNIRSVIVFGRIQILEDPQQAIDITRQLSLKYTDDIVFIEREIQESGRNVLVFRLMPEHITGKLVNES